MSIRPRFTVQSSNVASLETPPFVDDVPNKTCLIYTGCSPIVNGCRSKIDISIHIMSAWNAEVSSKVRFLWLKSHISNQSPSYTHVIPLSSRKLPENPWKSPILPPGLSVQWPRTTHLGAWARRPGLHGDGPRPQRPDAPPGGCRTCARSAPAMGRS